jgi:FkbM family methyltransferase
MDSLAASSASSFPVNMREGVIWAYRLLLCREPNDESAVDVHIGHNIDSLRKAFVDSPEYHLIHGADASRLSAEHAAVINAFMPFCTSPAPAGSWHDFLGVRTQCDYMPDSYVDIQGQVQGPPGSPNGPIHDVEEWVGTLRSVLEARDRFVVVELGAGWAPWLVAGAKAAERVGLQNVMLVGVEGSMAHVDFMHRHLEDNGIDPSQHRLIHGVVGACDGVAYFPKLSEPNNIYGAEAEFNASVANCEMEEVKSFSLATLLSDISTVDILHCDIQGMEAEVFRAGRNIVDRRVRRVVIGTHSRKIEAELLDIFSGLDWVLEEEVVCKLVQSSKRTMCLQADGVQVWRNPRQPTGL